jgi:hypothetical protein
MPKKSSLLGFCLFNRAFLQYSSIDETKGMYSISEIKQWTPHSIQTEFNRCRSIGIEQCGNFCSGIKNNKLAVVDCLSQHSNDISKCDGVYQSLNF